MAGTKIQMTAAKHLTLSQICQRLNQLNTASDVERVAHLEHSLGDVQSVLLVYERYYTRVSSYASLTILLTEHGQTQTADLVSSGGGDGYLNLSLGANRSFAKEYAKALEECGFTTHEDDTPKSFFKKLEHLLE